jgi:hypothetical protein
MVAFFFLWTSERKKKSPLLQHLENILESDRVADEFLTLFKFILKFKSKKLQHNSIDQKIPHYQCHHHHLLYGDFAKVFTKNVPFTALNQKKHTINNIIYAPLSDQ